MEATETQKQLFIYSAKIFDFYNTFICIAYVSSCLAGVQPHHLNGNSQQRPGWTKTQTESYGLMLNIQNIITHTDTHQQVLANKLSEIPADIVINKLRTKHLELLRATIK